MGLIFWGSWSPTHVVKKHSVVRLGECGMLYRALSVLWEREQSAI